MAWGRRLRRKFGATPIAGEVLPEFRWLLLHLGTSETGGRVELIEPTGPGFLARFLAAHGEGPHHITFTVPDLRATVGRVAEIGGRVVGEDYGHTPWQEAFIYPDGKHEIVVQLAQTDRDYPDAATLVSTSTRNPDRYPSSRGAKDRTWWLPVWDAHPGPTASMVRIHLASTDLEFSAALFAGVLRGSTSSNDKAAEYRWVNGALNLVPSEPAGIVRVELSGTRGAVSIGTTQIGPGSLR